MKEMINYTVKRQQRLDRLLNRKEGRSTDLASKAGGSGAHLPGRWQLCSDTG